MREAERERERKREGERERERERGGERVIVEVITNKHFFSARLEKLGLKSFKNQNLNEVKFTLRYDIKKRNKVGRQVDRASFWKQ